MHRQSDGVNPVSGCLCEHENLQNTEADCNKGSHRPLGVADPWLQDKTDISCYRMPTQPPPDCWQHNQQQLLLLLLHL
jgi:hypothetical protein